VRSPDSDISPTASAPAKAGTAQETRLPPQGQQVEYFPPVPATELSAIGEGVAQATFDDATAKGKGKAPATPPLTTAASEGNTSPGVSFTEGNDGEGPGRKASVSSLTFRRPRNPSLPQGDSKRTDGNRIRAASPPHKR